MKDGDPPVWTAKKNIPAVSSSYHNYMVDNVIEDLMQHVLQVHDRPASDDDVSWIIHWPKCDYVIIFIFFQFVVFHVNDP